MYILIKKYIDNFQALSVFLIAIILFTSWNNCHGQDLPKWKVGIYFAPEYQYRTLKATKEGFMKNFVKPDRDSTEIYRISYNTGVSLQYAFNKNFSIRSGLFFSDRGMKLRKVPICRPGPAPNCITGWIGKLDAVDSVESVYKNGYLTIPVLVQYDFNISKFMVGALGGISGDYLVYVIDRNTEYASNNESLTYNSKKNSSYYHNFIYNFIVGVNIERQISSRINLALEPTLRYSGSVYDPGTGRLQTKLYSLGIGFHLKYNYKK